MDAELRKALIELLDWVLSDCGIFDVFDEKKINLIREFLDKLEEEEK